jgi:hypothetical protein
MSINVECEDMFLSSGATSLRGVSIYAIWRSRAKRAHTSRLSVASRIFGSFSVCASNVNTLKLNIPSLHRCTNNCSETLMAVQEGIIHAAVH